MTHTSWERAAMTVRICTLAVLCLLGLPVAAAAQQVTEPQFTPTAIAPLALDTIGLTPFEPRTPLPDEDVRIDLEQERESPQPFVIGGAIAGAFAGGLIGWVNCGPPFSNDAMCSAFRRMATGAAMGAVVGAVLWLATVPQDR